MSISIATKTDLTGIKEIWQEVFPAEFHYINTVFNSILPLCTSYVYKKENKICSVISLMPMSFINEELGIHLKGWYMFGVATRKEYEGGGFASALIKEAVTELRRKDFDFIFERPANQSLNKFYLKQGFTESIKKHQFIFPLEFVQKSRQIISGSVTDQELETTQEIISNHIKHSFDIRFEWENSNILKGLITLGEIERHNALQTEASFNEETFIAINPLKPLPDGVFNNAFFCFPLE